jgi:hypothetical protein
MERPKSVRKAVALGNAILLVGLLVALTAGLSFMGGSKSNPVFKTVGQPTSKTSAPSDRPAAPAGEDNPAAPGRTSEPSRSPP